MLGLISFKWLVFVSLSSAGSDFLSKKFADIPTDKQKTEYPGSCEERNGGWEVVGCNSYTPPRTDFGDCTVVITDDLCNICGFAPGQKVTDEEISNCRQGLHNNPPTDLTRENILLICVANHELRHTIDFDNQPSSRACFEYDAYVEQMECMDALCESSGVNCDGLKDGYIPSRDFTSFLCRRGNTESNCNQAYDQCLANVPGSWPQSTREENCKALKAYCGEFPWVIY